MAIGEHYAYTAQQANVNIGLMSGLGINAVRLILKWNDSGTLGPLQAASICNTARAMIANHMTILTANLMPAAGDWPKDGDALGAYRASEGAIFDLLLGQPGCALGSRKDGSPAPMLNLHFIGPNEINLTTFCDAGTDDGDVRQQKCAEWYVPFQHTIYDTAQQAELKYGVPITVVGLVLGSHHNPLNEIADVCRVWKASGYGVDMDQVGFHPYPLPQTYEPDGQIDPYSGVRMTPLVQSAISNCFGRPISVVYTEMGYETAVPTDKGYTGVAQNGVLYVDPATRVALTEHVAMLATSYDVVGIYNFLLFDEQSLESGWQSGLYYWNGDPKPFLSNYQFLMACLADPD
jgi:hypothetical protein